MSFKALKKDFMASIGNRELQAELDRIQAAGYSPEEKADQIKGAKSGAELAANLAVCAAYVEAGKQGVRRLFGFDR
jgi:hypothetical protein